MLGKATSRLVYPLVYIYIYNRNHHGDIHGCLSENGVFTPIISEDIIYIYIYIYTFFF